MALSWNKRIKENAIIILQKGWKEFFFFFEFFLFFIPLRNSFITKILLRDYYQFYLIQFNKCYYTFCVQGTMRDMKHSFLPLNNIVRRFHHCANFMECTYPNLLYSYATSYSLLLLGYQPVQYVIVQNNMRWNQGRQKMTQSQDCKHETAARATQHTVTANI